MALPENWRQQSTTNLTILLGHLPEPRNDDEAGDIEELIVELELRDAQAAANRGEMNGLAPEY